MKKLIKRVLIILGLRHPALEKSTGKRKIEILLENKGTREVFVETGTEFGTTVRALQPYFKTLHSIELDKKLSSYYTDITGVSFYFGDSGEVLKEVMEKISEPALFWLDAHPPGDLSVQNCPVFGELAAIFSHRVKGHKILIDDARRFSMRDIHVIKKAAQEHGMPFRLQEGLMIIN